MRSWISGFFFESSKKSQSEIENKITSEIDFGEKLFFYEIRRLFHIKMVYKKTKSLRPKLNQMILCNLQNWSNLNFKISKKVQIFS